MPWTLTEVDEGYLLCRVKGHMADPFGVLVSQEKAEFILEQLEWGETLAAGGVTPAPPVFKPKRARSKKAP